MGPPRCLGVHGIGYRRGSLGHMDKVQRTEAQWREMLTPDEYQVLREAGTEAPWTGAYTSTRAAGVYRCRACGAELFRSGEKFESHCGWPSFSRPTAAEAVVRTEPCPRGMLRPGVGGGGCASPLGQVLGGEGSPAPTAQRGCITPIPLTLDPADGEGAAAAGE